MNYWRGIVDWPIKKDWKCETCGSKSFLIWGLVHGQCRCNICHTQYMMRNKDEAVDVPISRLKDEYKSPARKGYEEYKKPISKFTDDEWDKLLNKGGQP